MAGWKEFGLLLCHAAAEVQMLLDAFPLEKAVCRLDYSWNALARMENLMYLIDFGNIGGGESMPIPSHGFMWSLDLTLPPLAMIFLKRTQAEDRSPG